MCVCVCVCVCVWSCGIYREIKLTKTTVSAYTVGFRFHHPDFHSQRKVIFGRGRVHCCGKLVDLDEGVVPGRDFLSGWSGGSAAASTFTCSASSVALFLVCEGGGGRN